MRDPRRTFVCIALAALFGTSACAAPTAPDEDEGAASGASAATVGARTAVRVTSPDLHQWMRDLWDRGMQPATAGQFLVECASVVELPGAHLCAAPSPDATNKALVRATLYTEGGMGHPRGVVPSHEGQATRVAMAVAAGHDLRSEHLQAFWRDAKRACTTKGRAFCPSAEEKALFEGYLLPAMQGGRPFVVIAFGATSVDTTGSHEILHAQYFLTPAFRAATDSFWKDVVTERDKAKARELFAPHYDVKDEGLVANEFMAYLLAYGAASSTLSEFVPAYADRLRQALETAGAAPLEVVPER